MRPRKKSIATVTKAASANDSRAKSMPHVKAVGKAPHLKAVGKAPHLKADRASLRTNKPTSTRKCGTARMGLR
jgi:hypothetical protein